MKKVLFLISFVASSMIISGFSTQALAQLDLRICDQDGKLVVDSNYKIRGQSLVTGVIDGSADFISFSPDSSLEAGKVSQISLSIKDMFKRTEKSRLSLGTLSLPADFRASFEEGSDCKAVRVKLADDAHIVLEIYQDFDRSTLTRTYSDASATLKRGSKLASIFYKLVDGTDGRISTKIIGIIYN